MKLGEREDSELLKFKLHPRPRLQSPGAWIPAGPGNHPYLSPPISKANSNKHHSIVYHLTAQSQSPTISNEAIGPSARGIGSVPEVLERKQEKASSKYPPIGTSSFLFDTLQNTRPHFESFARSASFGLLPCLHSHNLLEPPLMCCESRTEFQKNIRLDKKDFATVEYLLRKGQRQLEMYSAPGIKDIL